MLSVYLLALFPAGLCWRGFLFLAMSGKMCIFATSNTPKSARVKGVYLRLMNLANSIWYRNNAMFNVHGWAYSSPYYIPSAWASALLILYQGQCESLMSGISKVADSRALFICSPQHNYHSNAKGIALGRSCARHGLGRLYE